jgi:hypothetical protein
VRIDFRQLRGIRLVGVNEPSVVPPKCRIGDPGLSATASDGRMPM